MSSDIYIPLSIVLTHPGKFEIKAALNGCTEVATAELNDNHETDWEFIRDQLTPVLLCKFGARATWRHVTICTNTLLEHTQFVTTSTKVTEMRVNCSGDFRDWLIHWLEENGFEYTNPDFGPVPNSSPNRRKSDELIQSLKEQIVELNDLVSK